MSLNIYLIVFVFVFFGGGAQSASRQEFGISKIHFTERIIYFKMPTMAKKPAIPTYLMNYSKE